MVSKSAALCISMVVVCLLVCEGEAHRMAKRSEVRVCGKALAQLMSVACGGNYNGPSNSKRFIDDAVASLEHGPIRGGMFDTGVEYYSQRTRRGIVNECCYQSCKWSTLRSYCGGVAEEDQEQQAEDEKPEE